MSRSLLLALRGAAAIALVALVVAGTLMPPILLASEETAVDVESAATVADSGQPELSGTPDAVQPPAGPEAPAEAVAGVLTLSDDFENPFGGILLRMNASRGSVHAVQGYEAGEYVMRKSDPRTVAPGVVEVLPGTYRDSTVSADVRLVGETPGRYASLSCRLSPEESAGYTLEVRPHDRSFRILRRDPSRATPAVLVDWRSSDSINAGTATNRIGLSCTGSTVTALANGASLATVTDSTYPTGRVALAAGADRATGITWEARWDNLLLVAS